ncbi:hypothetical protein ACWD1Y_45015 [Streptomyces sp. NPDC002814]
MPLPQLTVYRHDRRKRALLTLSGEIDLESAPLVRTALERCLGDGIRAIDVDLADCAFLLLGLPFGHLSPPLGDAPVASSPAAPHRHVPMVPVLSGKVR